MLGIPNKFAKKYQDEIRTNKHQPRFGRVCLGHMSYGWKFQTKENKYTELLHW